MDSLRVFFMGTADLSCPILRALIAAPFIQVVGVATQPDRPKGRDLKLQPSPVKVIALEAGLPLLQPERARHPEFLAQLKQLAPTLIVVAAYGQILPASILELPRFGCINVHTSLLPKYRGAAPIQWALINDEKETGVTIMKMDAGLDTGDILSQEVTPIGLEDDAQSLHDRLAKLGAELLLRTIVGYVEGGIVPRPQPTEGVSHAPKIRKEDGRVHWDQPALSIWNRLRGLVPWPGLFTFFETPINEAASSANRARQSRGQLLKIWGAEPTSDAGTPGRTLRADKQGLVVACGQGALRITVVQPEGGRRMTAAEFLAGHSLPEGTVLG
jgi:methionyl-tRNA formyltransferase